MRARLALLSCAALTLASCAASRAAEPEPAETVADRVMIDKSERTLSFFAEGREVARFRNLRFGAEPVGHKQFQGDRRTPEGRYTIDGRNPESRYHLSLRISYPNAADRAFAAAFGRSPGGDIFIHGQPNGRVGPPLAHDWTDGCIALSDTEIEELWELVADGTPIDIQP